MPAGAVVLGTLLTTVFATIGIAVVRIERKEGAHVYMGPAGFFFIEE